MNKNRSFGLLPFFKSDQSQDWQLSGNYNNFKLAIQNVPRDTLVGFMTPWVDGTVAPPTEITIRKLKIVGSVKTILSSSNYTVTLDSVNRNSLTYYYFNQSPISETPSEYLDAGCLYEIYIEDSEENSFISNIFLAVDENELTLYREAGDGILTEDGETILI